MPDFTAVPGWAWPTGGAAFFIAIGYLWPLMQQSLTAKTVQWRTENAFMVQMAAERDKAIAEKAAAEKRADDYFQQFADMKTEVRMLTLQLQFANERIEELTRTVNELRGVKNA